MDNQTGKVYPTKNCGELEVIEFFSSKNVRVKFFSTGYEASFQLAHIVRGEVKDPLFASIFGVGLLGVGNYKPSTKGKQTDAYKCWYQMLRRCYSKIEHQRKPWYIGCTVHPEWHNFQNFAKWYDENYPADGGDYHLDKDIKIEGNKEYSPSSCMFVSPKDNAIKAAAKTFNLISPKGEEIKVYNLTKFCRDNGLSRQAMHNMIIGKSKSSQGWMLS